MNTNSRLMAALAYLPVIGWVIVLVFQRANSFAMFHQRQSIGLVLSMIGSLLAWAVIAWICWWISMLSVVAVALFALVIAAWLFGLLVLIIGIANALNKRKTPLPMVGHWAARLPI